MAGEPDRTDYENKGYDVGVNPIEWTPPRNDEAPRRARSPVDVNEGGFHKSYDPSVAPGYGAFAKRLAERGIRESENVEDRRRDYRPLPYGPSASSPRGPR